MGAVWVRVRSDIRGGWRSIATLVLLVGLFGGVVLAAAAGARRTATAYSRFTARAADYDVFLAPEEAVDHLTGPLYDEIDRLPQVRRSARLSAFQIYGLDADGHIDQFFAAQAATTDARGRLVVGNPKLLAGRLPRPDAANEALVNRFLAERLDLRPGGRVTMQLFRGPLDDHPALADVAGSTPVTFTVVGIGAFTNDIVPANSLDSVPRLYLSTAGAATYGDPQYVNFTANLIQLRPGTDLAQFREEVDAVHARHPEIVGDLNFALQAGRRSSTERALRPQAVALGLFALLAGLTSFFVFGQLLARLVGFSADELMTLRALGMARRDLFAVSMAHAVFVALGGAALSVGFAVAASPLFPLGPARLAEPDPGLDVNIAVLGLGAALLGVGLVARVVPVAWRTAIASPGREVATAPPGRSARRGLAEVAAIAGFPPAVTMGTSMALETGRGGRGTERRAIVATAVALAGLSAALVFGVNLSRFLSTPELYGQTWDEAVDFQYSEVPGAEVLEAVDGNPAVKAVAGGTFGVVAVAGRQVPAVGLDQLRGSVFPTLLEGRAPSSPDEIVLGTTVLRQSRLSVGDAADVEVPGGTRRMRVVGRAVFPLLGKPGLEPTGLGHGAAVTGDVLAPPGPGAAAAYNFFLIDYLGDRAHRGDVATAHQALEGPCGGVCVIDATLTPGDVLAFDRVRLTPLALSGLLGLLTVATLAQSLVSSIRRRRRDLAVIRALGFLPRQVVAAVAWQASALVVLASLVGVPLGVIAGRRAWAGLAAELGVGPDVRLPFLTLLLLVLATVAVANLVAVGPGMMASRLRPATVLHVE